MTRNRTIIAFGIILFLILAGTGTASALWSSLSSARTTVTAATMGIQQTGFDGLTVAYGGTTTSRVAPIAVTNTGTVASTFTLVMRAPSSTMATSTLVQVTPVGSAADCGASTRFTGTSTWFSPPQVKGTLAGGATSTYCVKSSMTAQQVAATIGQSVTVTLTLSSESTTEGDSWNASIKDVTMTQVSRDSVPPVKPAVPTVSATSGYSTTVAFTATTDDVGVAGYDLYRDGVLIASNVTSPYTDTTLSARTAYQYTIVARDAAGNASTSDAVRVTSLPVASAFRYLVKSATDASRCANVANGRDGTAVAFAACNNSANQAWSFLPGDDGTYRISGALAPDSGWYSGPRFLGFGSTQQQPLAGNETYSTWVVRPVAEGSSNFRFVNTGTGECLVSAGFLSSNFSTASCTTTTTGTQVFNLTPAP
jgi:hypothetical protein